MDSFFQKRKNNEDQLYSQIRDFSERAEANKQIEYFWVKYRTFVQGNEKSFLSKAQMKATFKQCWWEMTLSIGLLNIGIKIKKKRTEKGPDILIDNPFGGLSKIHIEAMAPKEGETVDKLPGIKWGVHDVPEKEFLLRLSGAFLEKYRKYKSYLDKNIVCENDIFIIAISTCNLSQYGSLMDFPCDAPLKFLSGAGNMVLSPQGVFSRYRPQIMKDNSRPVEMSYFLKKEYDGISAILYSNTDVLNCPDNPEEKFLIIKNPIAKNPLPNLFFGSIKSWAFNKKLKIWKIE